MRVSRVMVVGQIFGCVCSSSVRLGSQGFGGNLGFYFEEVFDLEVAAGEVGAVVAEVS